MFAPGPVVERGCRLGDRFASAGHCAWPRITPPYAKNCCQSALEILTVCYAPSLWPAFSPATPSHPLGAIRLLAGSMDRAEPRSHRIQRGFVMSRGKQFATASLSPFAWAAGQVAEPLRRAWAHARLARKIASPLDPSVVILGVPEIHGTGR